MCAPIAWRGSEQLGVSAQQNKIHLAIATWEWPSYFDPAQRLKGIRLDLAEYRRPDPATAPCLAKAAGLYMICTISKHRAERKGYADAMMLDWQGRVAECTGANIFFIKDGKIHTPIADCFLAGITRATAIMLAKKRGIEVIERRIMPDELSNFSECFITGTAAEVTAVSEIAQWKFTPGAITKQLMDDYTAEVQPKGKAAACLSEADRRRARTPRRCSPRCRARETACPDRRARSAAAAAPDFAKQAPTLVEVPACFIQNPPDHRKSVASSVKSQLRLVPAFGRKRGHAFVVDIRRIGDDEIVARGLDRREQIAAQQPNALLQAMVRDISPGDLDRRFGKLDRIDLRLRKAQRSQDRETSRAGAKIEHAGESNRAFAPGRNPRRRTVRCRESRRGTTAARSRARRYRTARRACRCA